MASGWASGELSAPLYADAVAALHRWHARGLSLHVYSSGAERAQRDFFSHVSHHGNLSHLITSHWDTVSAGPKKDSASYDAIRKALALEAEKIFFLSDDEDEVKAARNDGWQARVVVRPGNRPLSAHAQQHEVLVTSFDQLE